MNMRTLLILCIISVLAVVATAKLAITSPALQLTLKASGTPPQNTREITRRGEMIASRRSAQGIPTGIVSDVTWEQDYIGGTWT